MKQLPNQALLRPDLETYKAQAKLPVCVLLDNVRSGLNVGAIFRTCDAFAIEHIYLLGITVQPPHPEVLKTALGATDSVSWSHSTDTDEQIREIKSKGYQLIAVEQTDKSVSLETFSFQSSESVVLVFGNEMRGISPALLEACDAAIEIPQSGIKHSLNVATSAGILLWEVYRQNLLRRFSSG